MMSDKLNKFLVVVFLTLLIWTWAFMSKAKERSFVGTLKISPSIDPSLLVTFSLNDSDTPQTEISLKSLNFEGAPSELSHLHKRYTLPPGNPDVERLDFYYDPGERTEGYKLDILTYLKANSRVQDMSLALESCNPSEITVNIEQLEKKKLPVECLDKGGQPLPAANPEPAFVEIYVRAGDYDKSAIVKLTPQQMAMARTQPVEAIPFVELGAARVRREAASPVQITLTSKEQLKPQLLKTTKPIGIIMSQELQNKYKVTILNEDKIRVKTNFSATDEAFKAYEEVDYPLQIKITASDVSDLSQTLLKEIIYNFPTEYIRSGEIELAEEVRRQASIKIELLNPE